MSREAKEALKARMFDTQLSNQVVDILFGHIPSKELQIVKEWLDEHHKILVGKTTSTVSVSFPKMSITVELVGSNSLVGALAERLIQRDLLKNVGCLDPDEICFNIKKVHDGVDIFEETKKVRDIFKIKESKIKVTFIN